MQKKSKANVVLSAVIAVFSVIAFTALLSNWYILRAAGDDVTLNPGDNIQTIVNAHPAGSTYTLTAGTYRQQSVTPKTGDTFTGEYGAVMNGSAILTGFTQSGSTWYVTGQTQDAYGYGDCQGSYPECSKPNELFIDDTRIEHVSSLGAVTADTWYFDYDADTIYIGIDPTGHTIENSITAHAFLSDGTNNNVTITNLIIEKYASSAQRGAIWAWTGSGTGEVTGWTVTYNEVRNNHGAGIVFGSDWTVTNNYVHHQGQIGISGAGDNTLVEANEISYNNQAGFDPGWEAGGTKFAYTDSLVVRNNYAHHNNGPGLWTDIENVNVLYDSNIVTYNGWSGLMHEISHAGEITGNFSGYNGYQFDTYVFGAQIIAQNSEHLDIHDNTVVVDESYGHGIIVLNQDRNVAGAFNTIHSNTIYNLGTQNNIVAFAGNDDCPSCDPPLDLTGYSGVTETNTFDYDTYYMYTPLGYHWGYDYADRQFTDFQTYGQETNGQVFALTSTPDIPTWDESVGQQDNSTPTPTDTPTATPTDTPTATPTDTPTATPAPSQSGTALSEAGPEACLDSSPNSPWLFGAIPQSNSSTLLYFTKPSGSNGFSIEYGTSSNSYNFGASNIAATDSNTFLVEYLSPGQTYYFRILAKNGCAASQWSNELTVSTLIPKNSGSEAIPNSRSEKQKDEPKQVQTVQEENKSPAEEKTAIEVTQLKTNRLSMVFILSGSILLFITCLAIILRKSKTGAK